MSATEASASYDLYVALHRSHRAHPEVFTMGRCTTILTAMMGGRPWSWRVVGITPAALQAFTDANFKKTSGDGITRAHIRSRFKTTAELLAPNEPLSIEEFARIWIANDKTVLCVRGENKDPLPAYIEFPQHSLFRSLQVSYQHRQSERDFLKDLARIQGLIVV